MGKGARNLQKPEKLKRIGILKVLGISKAVDKVKLALACKRYEKENPDLIPMKELCWKTKKELFDYYVPDKTGKKTFYSQRKGTLPPETGEEEPEEYSSGAYQTIELRTKSGDQCIATFTCKRGSAMKDDPKENFNNAVISVRSNNPTIKKHRTYYMVMFSKHKGVYTDEMRKFISATPD